MRRPELQGRLREARGHRHVGGDLCPGPQERHWITATVAIVTAIAAAVSTYAASQQAAAQQRYQAKVAKNQAINAQNLAAAEANRRRDLYNRQLASQRAAIGTSGVEAGEGSPLLVQMDSAEQAALDIANVRYQGEVRSADYRAEQNLMKWKARSTERLGYIGAGTSLLKGASKGYGAYARGSTGDQ